MLDVSLMTEVLVVALMTVSMEMEVFMRLLVEMLATLLEKALL